MGYAESGDPVEVSRLPDARAGNQGAAPVRTVSGVAYEGEHLALVDASTPLYSVPVETDVDSAASDGPVDVALCALARKERSELSEVTILTIEQNQVLKWRARSESNVMTLSQVLAQMRSDR
jgi:hypothetical protein